MILADMVDCKEKSSLRTFYTEAYVKETIDKVRPFLCNPKIDEMVNKVKELYNLE